MTKLLLSIVDDDPLYKYSFKRMISELELGTYDIIEFSDGEEALDFFKVKLTESDALPDIVFLDINMPFMDGFQFIEEYALIKQKVRKKITIYMNSTSMNPLDIERANKISEITDYIIKPIDPEKLKQIIIDRDGELRSS